jgi:endonuclease/exonuclease/phosphatase family metal-dependent hydrolase
MHTLAELHVVIQDALPLNIIVGGDFNIDFNKANPNLIHLRDFIDDFQLTNLDNRLPAGSDFAFHNSTGSAFSLIDHIMVSKNIADKVVEYNIKDSAENVSDHLPICLIICLENSCERANIAANQKQFT